MPSISHTVEKTRTVRPFLIIITALVLAIVRSDAKQTPNQTVLLSPPTSQRPIEIRIGFQLFDVVQIEETTETFEFSGILTVQWKDERQAFDPATEGVSEKFYQGNFQFNELATSWYPEVSLLNSVGAFEKGEPLLRVLPDGTAILVTPVNATAKSELKLRQYPFDNPLLSCAWSSCPFFWLLFYPGRSSGWTAPQWVTE
jgi:hypothetical protein